MRPDTFAEALHAWQGFYALLGGASATLIGLTFVAATLGAPILNDDSAPKVRTFLTPTVIYFSLVLLLSSLMNVPTQTRLALTFQFGVLGIIGAGYSLSHLPRLRIFHRDGDLSWQNWLWNLVLPLSAAALLIGAAFGLTQSGSGGLNAAAVGVLLLVMVGLHNAWGVTLYLARRSPP